MTQGIVNSIRSSSRIGCALTNSPSSIQVQSKNSIFQFNNENQFDFQMRCDFDAHPLKLRHGYGFDDEDQETTNNTNQHAIDARKINKLPFKVLDAPQL